MNFDMSILYSEFDFLLRILSGALCGALIGLERERRLKNAGIRTHVIVAISSVLMMIVSKYGFFDIVGYDSISVDASRIAAGVVTAIGFLGAGVIYVRKENTIGLTTAAGLWATVGIGITFGSGMYLLGFSCTAIILLFQFLFHNKLLHFTVQMIGSVKINMTKTDLSYKEIKEKLLGIGIVIRSIQITRDLNGDMILSSYVTFPRQPVETILENLENTIDIEAMDVNALS